MRRPVRGRSVPSEDRDAPASAGVGEESFTDDARHSARRDRASSTGDGDPAGAAAPPVPLLADSPAQAVPRMADVIRCRILLRAARDRAFRRTRPSPAFRRSGSP
eukprot:5258035-Lingulodinium_polyedra.AAC.1